MLQLGGGGGGRDSKRKETCRTPWPEKSQPKREVPSDIQPPLRLLLLFVGMYRIGELKKTNTQNGSCVFEGKKGKGGSQNGNQKDNHHFVFVQIPISTQYQACAIDAYSVQAQNARPPFGMVLWETNRKAPH